MFKSCLFVYNFTKSNAVIFNFRYGDIFPWPTSPAPARPSLSSPLDRRGSRWVRPHFIVTVPIFRSERTVFSSTYSNHGRLHMDMFFEPHFTLVAQPTGPDIQRNLPLHPEHLWGVRFLPVPLLPLLLLLLTAAAQPGDHLSEPGHLAPDERGAAHDNCLDFTQQHSMM